MPQWEFLGTVSKLNFKFQSYDGILPCTIIGKNNLYYLHASLEHLFSHLLWNQEILLPSVSVKKKIGAIFVFWCSISVSEIHHPVEVFQIQWLSIGWFFICNFSIWTDSDSSSYYADNATTFILFYCFTCAKCLLACLCVGDNYWFFLTRKYD